MRFPETIISWVLYIWPFCLKRLALILAAIMALLIRIAYPPQVKASMV
jgi:hypothetical protein